MTKLADRITKRPVKSDDSCVFDTETGYTYVLCYHVHNKTADAELIAEAINVTNATGKSPKELQEERDEAARIIGLITDTIGWKMYYSKTELDYIVKDFLNKVKSDSTH